MWAILGFSALILLSILLAGCCSFDRRYLAMKCMGYCVMFAMAGLLVCSLTGLILAFDGVGKSCRGTAEYSIVDPGDWWSFKPIVD